MKNKEWIHFCAITIFALGNNWGCSSTKELDKQSLLNPSTTNTIKISLKKKLIFFHDSYSEDGQRITFGNLEDTQIILQHFEHLVPFHISNDGASINLSSQENFTLPKYTDDQYGKDKETLPMILSSYLGDCDHAEEIFSVVKSIDQNRVGISQYKWTYMGQGECSGNTKTTCFLELISSKEIDLKEKTGSNIMKKIKTKFKNGEQACKKLENQFLSLD